VKNKLLVSIVTTISLASASVAFANPQNDYRVNSYKACDPYAGTVWDGVAPYGSTPECDDPYKGTVWEGIAPY
jgi:hypothetical protein